MEISPIIKPHKIINSKFKNYNLGGGCRILQWNYLELMILNDPFPKIVHLFPLISNLILNKQYFRSLELAARKLGRAGWSSVVTILLVEGRDLLAMDEEGTSDPYCKFRFITIHAWCRLKWNFLSSVKTILRVSDRKEVGCFKSIS